LCAFFENKKIDLHKFLYLFNHKKQTFFKGLGKNACLLQRALKSTAPGL